ncbi:cation diffusion facilitator family transporter [Palleronia pelagia]|uniref:Cobalt-zinc-cadmium efflux system protein n=1 Tax=Palleronia pelagia TaxID=387096 RepID=A0A1H8KPD7_9RHOB|nr:cation diffusion facilitator family transporter [Palleronia pelagia]SEN94727.1 cobalt-zinc-cadmium efflux system protein [Palleronia pelagia]
MPHDHVHHAGPEGDRRVALAVGVNIVLTVAQVVGGLLSGSLALIADALHNLSDALSLIIALVARRIAQRPADDQMTFGYGRAEVVAALVNLTTLIVLGLFLIYEGIGRLFDPQPIDGWIVVILAAIALVVDLVTAFLTYAMAKGSMNIRAAFLHNLADALGSVGVIVAGTLVLLYDWRLVDPIVTLGIAAYILWHGVAEIGPAIRLLMLGTPPEVETGAVREAIDGVEGVARISHLHLWQIDEGKTSVEARVVLIAGSDPVATARAVKAALNDRFGIAHATVEPQQD